MTKRHQYTTKQIEFLREAWQHEEYTMPELIRDFEKLFGVTLTKQQIKGTLQRYKIKSPRKCGLKKGQITTSSFKVGNKPKPNAGQFKLGNTPWNKKDKDNASNNV